MIAKARARFGANRAAGTRPATLSSALATAPTFPGAALTARHLRLRPSSSLADGASGALSLRAPRSSADGPRGAGGIPISAAGAVRRCSTSLAAAIAPRPRMAAAASTTSTATPPPTKETH